MQAEAINPIIAEIMAFQYLVNSSNPHSINTYTNAVSIAAMNVNSLKSNFGLFPIMNKFCLWLMCDYIKHSPFKVNTLWFYFSKKCWFLFHISLYCICKQDKTKRNSTSQSQSFFFISIFLFFLEVGFSNYKQFERIHKLTRYLSMYYL